MSTTTSTTAGTSTSFLLEKGTGEEEEWSRAESVLREFGIVSSSSSSSSRALYLTHPSLKLKKRIAIASRLKLFDLSLEDVNREQYRSTQIDEEEEEERDQELVMERYLSSLKKEGTLENDLIVRIPLSESMHLTDQEAQKAIANEYSTRYLEKMGLTANQKNVALLEKNIPLDMLEVSTVTRTKPGETSYIQVRPRKKSTVKSKDERDVSYLRHMLERSKRTFSSSPSPKTSQPIPFLRSRNLNQESKTQSSGSLPNSHTFSVNLEKLCNRYLYPFCMRERSRELSSSEKFNGMKEEETIHFVKDHSPDRYRRSKGDAVSEHPFERDSRDVAVTTHGARSMSDDFPLFKTKNENESIEIDDSLPSNQLERGRSRTRPSSSRSNLPFRPSSAIVPSESLSTGVQPQEVHFQASDDDPFAFPLSLDRRNSFVSPSHASAMTDQSLYTFDDSLDELHGDVSSKEGFFRSPNIDVYDLVDVLSAFFRVFPFDLVAARFPSLEPDIFAAEIANVSFANRVLRMAEFLWFVVVQPEELFSSDRMEVESKFVDEFESILEFLYFDSSKWNITMRIPIILLIFRTAFEEIFRHSYPVLTKTERFDVFMQRINRVFTALFDPKDLLSHLSIFESNVPSIREMFEQRRGVTTKSTYSRHSFETSYLLRFVLDSSDSWQSREFLNDGDETSNIFVRDIRNALSPEIRRRLFRILQKKVLFSHDTRTRHRFSRCSLSPEKQKMNYLHPSTSAIARAGDQRIRPSRSPTTFHDSSMQFVHSLTVDLPRVSKKKLLRNSPSTLRTRTLHDDRTSSSLPPVSRSLALSSPPSSRSTSRFSSSSNTSPHDFFESLTKRLNSISFSHRS